MARTNQHALFSITLIATLLAGVLLSACAPAVPTDQVEQELVAFTLRYMLRGPDSTEPVSQSGAGQWADAPQDANLIVWAPPNDSLKNDSIEFLKSDQPEKVWWFAKDRLVEVTDQQNAIRQFRSAHFSSISPDNHSWGYYEFGILSLSRGNTQAKVYVGISCGPLCGTGTIYTLERNETGQWEVKDSEMKWIS